MENSPFDRLEDEVFRQMHGRLNKIQEEGERKRYVELLIKGINPSATKEDISRIVEDTQKFEPIEKYLHDSDVEDVMINNTSSIFVYKTSLGATMKVPETIKSRSELDKLVNKLKLYASPVKDDNILDGHLPNGSRVNIVESPLGADITIRNFRSNVLSIIDLIDNGMLSFSLAARFWLYVDGLRVRPANIMIGGMPGSGKTTLLNALFSFFREDQRVIIIEDTYELNTSMQDNSVRLETNVDTDLKDLVKNSLRMRPDTIVVGEVRGEEARDMMTTMNIGKICMCTIHASTAKDVVSRLEHAPMNVEPDIIPLIDAIIIVSQVREADNTMKRIITQVAEVSALEGKVMLSDLYSFNYKTHKGSDIAPSITFREILSRISGLSPVEIIAEEQRRALILQRLKELNVRDVIEINKFCKAYYENPDKALSLIGMEHLSSGVR